MKRYIVFYGDRYYPQGGWEDCIGSFDSVKAGRKQIIHKILEDFSEFDGTKIEEYRYAFNLSWWHIYDTKEQKIIYNKS